MGNGLTMGRELALATIVLAGFGCLGEEDRSEADAEFSSTDIEELIPCPTPSNPNTYSASADFSSVQGCRQWSYLDSAGAKLSFDSTKNRWVGAGVAITNTWEHPGMSVDAVRRWTAPAAGEITIKGSASDLDAGGGDGVKVTIRRGSSVLWQKTIANGNSGGFSFDLATPVTANDHIDFVVNRNGEFSHDKTTFVPTIGFNGGSGGVTGGATVRRTLISDKFDRPNSSEIGATWRTGYSGKVNAQIVSNEVRGTATNTSDPKSAETSDAVALPNDQWCQITLGKFTGSEDRETGCTLRAANPSTVNWYWCYARKTQTSSPARNAAIVRHGNGDTNLASDFTTVWGSGDKLRCEVQGKSLRLYRIPAGGAPEKLLLSATDATYTHGRAGILMWMKTGGNLANATITDWAAGDFVKSP